MVVLVLTTLQQYLPFTVLKHLSVQMSLLQGYLVATVLTVYGIETIIWNLDDTIVASVATVLTVYGIETYFQML